MSFMTPAEIHAWQPYSLLNDGLTPLERAKRRVQQAGQWKPYQILGKRFAIGCVALEITQRCNLDCTYCYLSEASEALKDIPLQEVFRRIDMIHAHYGDGTDIQVTGGDPTLRKRSELLQIIRYIRERKMRSSLFTNGIKASRDMLEELCDAGLEDVAFHVDMTQERKGYKSEMELNAVRLEYIERARGLPLSVFFNTTAYPDNFHEIPDLCRFFIEHCDVVRLAAFQVGADTGRGTIKERVTVNSHTVQLQMEKGIGTPLRFDAFSAGHSECNGYAFGVVVNGKVYDFFNDVDFVQEMNEKTAHLEFSRRDKRKSMETMAEFLFKNPRMLAGFTSRAAKVAWAARHDLIAARGKVGKLSFHIHNFQDAKALDGPRCEACTFMVMTPEGPMSMCIHNAKRDDYLLVPAEVLHQNAVRYFNPVTGQLQDTKPEKITVQLTRKNARGTAKVELEAARKAARQAA